MACEEGLTRELHHVHDGVELLQLGGAEETEEDGLGFGSEGRAVLLANLTGVDCHAHLLLGVAVVGADFGVIEEGEHLEAMAAQTLHEAFSVAVRPGGGDELSEPSMELGLAPRVALGGEFSASLTETHGIAQQAGEFFAEAPPRGSGGE